MYATELVFDVPAGAQGLRLLVSTTAGWPDRMVIGDENSCLHKKTYFALRSIAKSIDLQQSARF